MAIHGLTESLSERLQQMEREGRLKGRESVVVGFVPSKDGRGPRFLIEDEGDKLFLRMNSNSYLGMAVRLEIVEAEERAAVDYLVATCRAGASACRLPSPPRRRVILVSLCRSHGAHSAACDQRDGGYQRRAQS